ncbi:MULTISPECIES: type II toxin-antitoxin system VapC family toxin [Rhodococcus]|uniref:Ribonuclease n=1 Tax=Rhodococcoides kyotonense TaxID=398843 RepID=A0A177YET5_9NOCA|nr:MULTISPECIES: type II toxin-antitoxin system VapC family toxin [Rhodococcus]NIL76017.1 Ribonuclease VapC32 [Rhodococcus sp. B10]OAK53739.1 ribonuclease [Rhodococcus kyotonensis]
MILVDTSIWIDHLRSGNDDLAHYLTIGVVLVHPWVTGEIALGNLHNRTEILGLLTNLPQASVAEPAELFTMIERERLYGRGIGFVDVQLLAATRLTPDAQLWTRDRRLSKTAAALAIRTVSG